MKRRKGLNMEIVPKKNAADQRDGGVKESSVSNQIVTQHHNLRLCYHDFTDSLMREDDIIKEDVNEFIKKITIVESLHEQVQRPREQITDAETLLGITHKLCSHLKSYENSEGALLPDFISGLLEKYNDNGVAESCKSISWKNMGSDASYIFRNAPGISTMFGTLDSKLIHRKLVTQKKRVRQHEISCPNEIEDTHESSSDTEKNVVTMFSILKKRKCVQFEKLVCNRSSFSQTVENIFALSFLVKDGRAEITVKDSGHQFVVPRNAPTAEAIASGEVSYSHFVLRFDYGDWKLMLDRVATGEEAMPQRITYEDCKSSLENCKELLQGSDIEDKSEYCDF